jgi:hypothetical protein
MALVLFKFHCCVLRRWRWGRCEVRRNVGSLRVQGLGSPWLGSKPRCKAEAEAEGVAEGPKRLQQAGPVTGRLRCLLTLLSTTGLRLFAGHRVSPLQH